MPYKIRLFYEQKVNKDLKAKACQLVLYSEFKFVIDSLIFFSILRF